METQNMETQNIEQNMEIEDKNTNSDVATMPRNSGFFMKYGIHILVVVIMIVLIIIIYCQGFGGFAGTNTKKLSVSGNATIDGNTTIGGNTTIDGNAVIKGSLTASSYIDEVVTTSLSVTGTITSSGTITSGGIIGYNNITTNGVKDNTFFTIQSVGGGNVVYNAYYNYLDKNNVISYYGAHIFTTDYTDPYYQSNLSFYVNNTDAVVSYGRNLSIQGGQIIFYGKGNGTNAESDKSLPSTYAQITPGYGSDIAIGILYFDVRILNRPDGSTNIGAFQFQGDNGTKMLKIDQNGIDVVGDVTADNISNSSDYRLKENIEPLSDNYTIDDLKPCSYNLISDETKKKNTGFIAHELQEVFPHLVTGEKDGEDTQTVNYIGLIAILTKELQDLKSIVKDLQLKNISLEEKISQLL